MLGGGEDTVFTLPGQQLFSLAEPDGLGFFPAVGIRSYARCLYLLICLLLHTRGEGFRLKRAGALGRYAVTVHGTPRLRFGNGT